MSDEIEIWLPDEQKTLAAGASLVQSIHRIPVTILCSGELGSGKSTFIRGCALGFGIREHVTSPTFALAQSYRTAQGSPFTHMDLYRLLRSDAREQVRATEEHGGIRCIEWSDRLEDVPVEEPQIHVALSERGSGRVLRIRFEDVPLPSEHQIRQWRSEVQLPANVIAHSDAVASFASSLAEKLLARGVIVRTQMLVLAGMVHDLFRFIDFRDGAGPPDVRITEDQLRVWEPWKARWKELRHEAACARFLEEQGFYALACVVAVHGLSLPSPERITIEQKLLFYADKRVMGATVVSLEERFRDFQHRYSSGLETTESRIWYEEAKRMEDELGLG